MTSHISTERIDSCIQEYLSEIKVVTSKNKIIEIQRETFLQLVDGLLACAKLHFVLQKLEGNNRFKVPEADLHRVHDKQLELTGLFLEIPTAEKNSLYETGVLLTLGDVIIAHTEHLP